VQGGHGAGGLGEQHDLGVRALAGHVERGRPHAGVRVAVEHNRLRAVLVPVHTCVVDLRSRLLGEATVPARLRAVVHRAADRNGQFGGHLFDLRGGADQREHLILGGARLQRLLVRDLLHLHHGRVAGLRLGGAGGGAEFAATGENQQQSGNDHYYGLTHEFNP
jgi:hypothetical protein